MFISDNEIMTVEEVCEVLYIGRNTAYELLSSGQLRGFRIGRVWNIPREALMRFIEERSMPTVSGE